MSSTKSTTTVTTQVFIEQYVLTDDDWTTIEFYLKMSEANKAHVRTFMDYLEEETSDVEDGSCTPEPF